MLSTAISRDVPTRTLLYAATAISFMAVSAGDGFRWAMMALLAVAGLWSLAAEHKFPMLFFSTPLKVGLITAGSVVLVAILAADPPADPAQPPRIVSRFLLWNAAVFMLSRAKTDYDLWIFAIIDLSFFMIAGAFHHPASFLALLPVALLLVLWAFHRSAALRGGPVPPLLLGGRPAWRHFRSGLVLAVLIFLLFPRRIFVTPPKAPDRLPAPAVNAGGGDGTGGGSARTGPSRTPGKLETGGLLEVKTDTTPFLGLQVFRRSVSDTPMRLSRALHLRQEHFDTYEGRGRWVSSPPPIWRIDENDGTKDGKVALPNAHSKDGTFFTQRIKCRLERGMALPLLIEPVSIDLPAVLVNGTGTVFAHREVPAEYIAVSVLPPSDQREQVSVLAVPAFPSEWTRLDAALPGLRQTARQIAAPKTHPLSKVVALERHLLGSTFAYTLSPPAVPEGEDPMEHFVATGRRGYCVHFAAALTLMCRSIGLPARLATGLLLSPNSYDDAQQCYVGRNSDAHAWTEVWFGPDQGWVVFDPTPAAPTPSALPEGPPVRTGDERPGTAEAPVRWDQLLAEYDGSLPTAIFGKATSAIGSALGWVAGVLFRPATGIVLVVVAAIVLMVSRLLPRAIQSKIRQRISGFPEITSVDFYQEFLWALSKRGFRKHPAQTPAEFAASVKTRLPERLVDTVTRAFYRERYGGQEIPGDERATLWKIVRQIDNDGEGARIQNPESRR